MDLGIDLKPLNYENRKTGNEKKESNECGEHQDIEIYNKSIINTQGCMTAIDK